MLLMYNKSFMHEDLVKETVKNEKIKVFKPEDFDNYVKQVKEKENKDVEVVFNTKLKSVKPDADDESKNYLIISETYFELIDKKDKAAKFYISVDEYSVIRVEKSGIFPIIIALLLAGLVVGGIFVYINKPAKEDPNNPLDMDTSQQTGQGEEIRTSDSEFYQESTVIPGYAEIEASKKAALIPLSNPEENTVNFVYTILNTKSSSVDKTFDNASDASAYVSENTVAYENVEENGKFFLKTPSGEKTTEFIEDKKEEKDGKVNVIKNVYDLVYFSKGIAPGNHIDWNCYDYLGTGDFNVQFRISTYDVETSSQCYGAVQTVHIIIK